MLTEVAVLMSKARAGRESVRASICELLTRTEREIPAQLAEVLPPASHGAPEWHAFERSIWALGEDIRGLFLQDTTLRKDAELQARILGVAVDRRAQRGRQPFVTLLEYKSCAHHAARLVDELEDPAVSGHVIRTIYKMKAHGFAEKVRPFLTHETAWVRNQAKRYVAWDT